MIHPNPSSKTPDSHRRAASDSHPPLIAIASGSRTIRLYLADGLTPYSTIECESGRWQNGRVVEGFEGDETLICAGHAPSKVLTYGINDHTLKQSINLNVSYNANMWGLKAFVTCGLDSRRLIACGNDCSRTLLFDADSGSCVLAFEQPPMYTRIIECVPQWGGSGEVLAGGDARYERPPHCIRWYDVSTAAPLQKLAGHTELVSEIKSDVEVGLVYSIARDGRVKLWDRNSSSACVATHVLPFPGMSLFHIPESNTLLCGVSSYPAPDMNTIVELDLRTGRVRTDYMEDGISSWEIIRVSQSLLATTGTGQVTYLFDRVSGKILSKTAKTGTHNYGLCGLGLGGLRDDDGGCDEDERLKFAVELVIGGEDGLGMVRVRMIAVELRMFSSSPTNQRRSIRRRHLTCPNNSPENRPLSTSHVAWQMRGGVMRLSSRQLDGIHTVFVMYATAALIIENGQTRTKEWEWTPRI